MYFCCDDDGFDAADVVAEAFEDKAFLLYEGVAEIPRDSNNRSGIISRVIGSSGSTLKLLQHKHSCRISYIKALGGFLISSGSKRKIEAAKRDIFEIAATVREIVAERLPFDVRIIRGERGERLAMVQRSFGVRIELRPLAMRLPDESGECLFARCAHSPFEMEATIAGRRGAVKRALQYLEAVDEHAARGHR